MTATPATGQTWRHKKTGRRIKLLNATYEDKHDPIGNDWRYRSLDTGRLGEIFASSLVRNYELEES